MPQLICLNIPVRAGCNRALAMASLQLFRIRFFIGRTLCKRTPIVPCAEAQRIQLELLTPHRTATMLCGVSLSGCGDCDICVKPPVAGSMANVVSEEPCVM